MKNKKQLLLVIFAALCVGSFLHAVLKFYVFRDYPLYGETECDPASQSCFVYECDSASEECSGNPEEDISYYALITKNASRVEVCDPSREECAPLECLPLEEGCEVTECTDELALEEETYCSSPEDFSEEDNNEPEESEDSSEAGILEE